jgi:hypothetical protein
MRLIRSIPTIVIMVTVIMSGNASSVQASKIIFQAWRAFNISFHVLKKLLTNLRIFITSRNGI